MKTYKKTILACLFVALCSGLGLYYMQGEPWKSIFLGILTGAIISIITTFVSYSVKKEEIFTDIGKELLTTYLRLSQIYSQLIIFSNDVSKNQENKTIFYKDITSVYSAYEKYSEKNSFDDVLNNYDSFLFNKIIAKFFVSKEIEVLSYVNDIHQINRQYEQICSNFSVIKIEIGLAELKGTIEQINNLIMKIDAQCNHSLNTIPQQLAFINHAMQNFEHVRKFANPWCVIKQDILSRNGLSDKPINDAELKFQEEHKRIKKEKASK